MSPFSLGRAVIKLRRSRWIRFIEPLLPRWIRDFGWRLTAAEDVIMVAGNKMKVPLSERSGLYVRDEYEPEVVAKLKELIKPGMTVCDVGANMGALTLLAARLVGPAGKVFAFEPFPANAAIIRENVALNGFTNVNVIEAAVSDQNGEAPLHLSQWCGSHCLAANPGASAGKTITVRTVRLDAVPGLDQIDLLKSDTEGTELAVLRGLGRLKPENLIVEANTLLFAIMGKPAPDFTGPGFLQALDELGYTILGNLTEPEAGVEPIKREMEGLWNLHLKPTLLA